MMSDLTDMVKYHNYNMSEIMQLTPFDYQLIKMMIIQSMQQEMDKNNG